MNHTLTERRVFTILGTAIVKGIWVLGMCAKKQDSNQGPYINGIMRQPQKMGIDRKMTVTVRFF